MRRKLTTLICAAGLLGGAAAAEAALIPIAIFPFNSPSEMDSFSPVEEGACAKKYRKSKAMGINLGKGATVCEFRTSVVADSSDSNPTQDLQATVTYEPKTPVNLRGKLFLSLSVRSGSNSGYEFRLIPAKQRWVLLRDPEGPAPEETLKAGTAKFIRPKPGKRNVLRLRATGTGPDVVLLASINGKNVFGTSESTSAGAPAGRFMEIGVGNKTGAVGTGMLGTFDDVTIRIPSPF